MTPRINFWQWISYSLRIRRVEYRIAEVPLFLMPALLAAQDTTHLSSMVFWEGLLAFLFLFSFGDLVNCLADRDLDAVYKPQLTQAVYGLGTTGVAIQAVVSVACSFAFTLHLAWTLERFVLLPMFGGGVFLAWAYSMDPLRLKARGLWQLGFYWLGLFAGPMIFTACLFTWPPPTEVLLFSLTFGLLQTGVILVNTAEDFPEDRDLGVRTIIVFTGLRAGLRLALALAALGWISLMSVIAWIGYHLGSGLGVLFAGIGPLLMAGGFVSVSLLRLVVDLPPSEADSIARAKRAARLVPVWITSCALTSLWAAAMLFWLRTGVRG